MGSRLATAAFNYGLFWALSRLVPTETLGGFSLLMNIFLMVQLLPLLGLTTPLIRRIATLPEESPVEITNAFAFAAPVSILLASMVGLWGTFTYDKEMSIAFWLVAASMLPTGWTTVAEAALVGKEQVAVVARVNFIESLLRTIFAVASIWLGHGLIGVFTVFFILRILAASLYAAHSSISFPRLRLWSWKLQKRNWAEVPVFFSIALVAALASRLDIITLSHFRGLHDVALYSASSRLYDAAQIIPTVLALVVLPTLARQFISARHQFSITLGLSVKISLIIGLGAALFTASFAQPIINLLYPPDIADSAPVLQWLIFAAIITTVDVVLSSTMLAASAQRHDLHSLSCGLLVLVLSLAVLGPRFGPVGAAAAVVLGLCARVCMRLRWAIRELGLAAPWLQLLKLAIAVTVGIAAMKTTMPHGALVSAIAALGSYVLAVIAMGTLGRHPLKELRDDILILTSRTQS